MVALIRVERFPGGCLPLTVDQSWVRRPWLTLLVHDPAEEDALARLHAERVVLPAGGVAVDELLLGRLRHAGGSPHHFLTANLKRSSSNVCVN